MQKQVTFGAMLLIIAVLLLSGCAPRTDSSMMADADALLIDLPAIVIDFASDGSPSIGGMSPFDLATTVPIDLAALSRGEFALDPYLVDGDPSNDDGSLDALALPAEWVNYFTATNIQHMEMSHGTDGISLMVNGQPIPSLMWDEGSLVATAEIAEMFNVMVVPTFNKVLPLVRQLNLGVILRFPVMAGADIIPMMVEDDGSAVDMAMMAQEEFLAAVGTPPKINLPVMYNADGSWSLGDLTDTEWSSLTRVPLQTLRLDPSLIADLSASGVSSMSLATDPTGIHISINGTKLPYLSWGSGEVQHLLALSQQMGLLTAMPGVTMADMDAVLSMIEALLPIIQVADVSISIHLP